jgi:hypothetical protein
MDKPIKLSLMDAAVVVNLLRTCGQHRDHVRISDDLTEQMMKPQTKEQSDD